MLNTEEFGASLSEFGFRLFSGVPCSFLKDLINYAMNSGQYVMASNEGDAVAICAGAYIGGTKSVFLCQNSGLTNAVSPLTSLNYPFKLPVLGFVSLRGEPGIQDEPQHELMGMITTELLDVMKIPWEYLADDIAQAKSQLARAHKFIEQQSSFFFVVRQGTFEKCSLRAEQKSISKGESSLVAGRSSNAEKPTRFAALQAITELADNETVFVATTGYTGRELYELGDRKHNFYMVGSMGCASSFSLGLALQRPEKRIVCIDGDGAALMRLGALPAIGYYAPKNLIHILLDNEAHDSTGGQETVSSVVDYPMLAVSSGYQRICHCSDLLQFSEQLRNWDRDPELTFLYLQIEKGARKDLSRPKIKPYEVKDRLMQHLG